MSDSPDVQDTSDGPDLSGIARPSQLWKQLSGERRLQAADAFWHDESAGNEQAEAIGMIAGRIKFRLKSVITMPVEKKVHYLVAIPAVSEILAARLLIAYHLKHQRPMMGAFLDALGIAHDEGIIADEEMKPPTAAALKKAAAAIAASYPADDVALYLSTLTWQDPDTWGALAELPEAAVKDTAIKDTAVKDTAVKDTAVKDTAVKNGVK